MEISEELMTNYYILVAKEYYEREVKEVES